MFSASKVRQSGVPQHAWKTGAVTPQPLCRSAGNMTHYPEGMGRGMGSPIPSAQEGAWVREDPKVFGGGLGIGSVDPFDLEPWRNMVTSHSLAGQLVLSLGTWTCQLMLRGRQATAPSTPWWLGVRSLSLLWSTPLMVRQVRWTPECGHTEFSFRRVPLLFMQRGVRFTFLGFHVSFSS